MRQRRTIETVFRAVDDAGLFGDVDRQPTGSARVF